MNLMMQEWITVIFYPVKARWHTQTPLISVIKTINNQLPDAYLSIQNSVCNFNKLWQIQRAIQILIIHYKQTQYLFVYNAIFKVPRCLPVFSKKWSVQQNWSNHHSINNHRQNCKKDRNKNKFPAGSCRLLRIIFLHLGGIASSKWQMTEWHLSVQFERKKGLISVLTIRLHMPAEILQNHAECIMSKLHKTASKTARLSLLW